jgi:RNA polymerase sigma-70 factor (ECF subfamily)
VPAKLRDIFVLREYGHLTYDELAAALSLNKGTVMSRLNRARRKIAAALEENKL